MKNRDKKCKECKLPVYARDMCRRHYKSWNSKKNNTHRKRWKKIKNNPDLLEKKRLADKKYREKKKLGIDTTRKKDDSSIINTDWQKYASLWTRKTNYIETKKKKSQKRSRELRDIAFKKYGGAKCLMCGVEDKRVLCFDHINDDGKKHREEINQLNIVYWMYQNDYPKMFQVLCRNCNWLKELKRR